MREQARRSGSFPGSARAKATPRRLTVCDAGPRRHCPPSERSLPNLECDVILAQEYEYTRFDALAWLARRMGIPLYATFQGGDRTLSWIEAIARQASLRACSGLIVASAAERERLAKAYPHIALNIANIANPIDTEEWKAIDRQEARKSLGLAARDFHRRQSRAHRHSPEGA